MKTQLLWIYVLTAALFAFAMTNQVEYSAISYVEVP